MQGFISKHILIALVVWKMMTLTWKTIVAKALIFLEIYCITIFFFDSMIYDYRIHRCVLMGHSVVQRDTMTKCRKVQGTVRV